MTATCRLIFAVLATSLVLGACGKKREQAPDAPGASAATTPESAAPAMERRSVAGRSYIPVDMSWKSLPADQFQRVRAQIRDVYWSGAERDGQKLAEDFSDDYRHQNDTFKRQEMLTALKSDLDKDFSAARRQADYEIVTENVEAAPVVTSYDPQAKGFHVSFGNQTERRGVGLLKDPGQQKQWLVRFVGVPQNEQLLYKPASEAEAKAIEAAIAANRTNDNGALGMKTAFMGHVAGAFYSQGDLADTALVEVDGVGIIDPRTGKTIFVLGQELGPIRVQCASTRKALHLPEPEQKTGYYDTVAQPC